MATGSEILARRKALDMTQDILAGAAGVSRSTVQRAERGLPISAESMRAMRAVLGLAATASATARTVPAAPVARMAPTSRERSPEAAWHADPCLLLPLLGVAALPWMFPDRALSLVAPRGDLDGNGIFNMFLAMTLTALLPAILAGRILWRRLRHPGATTMVFGFGKGVLAKFPWAGGCVEIRGVPVPALRWRGATGYVPTWPGAILALSLFLPATLAMHLPPVSGTISAPYASWGYHGIRQVSPTWRIVPGSPLEEAGLRLGDLVISIDGRPIRDNVDLWSAMRGAHGRVQTFEVARAAPPFDGQKGFSRATERVSLAVTPRRSSEPGPCTGIERCAWVGDIQGLVSTDIRDRSIGEALDRFGRELRVVASMAVHSSMAARAIYMEDREGEDMAFFLRWIVFRYAADAGAWTLSIALSLAVLAHGAGPAPGRLIRVLLSIAKRRARPTAHPSLATA